METIKKIVSEKFDKKPENFRLFLSGVELGADRVTKSPSISNSKTFKDLNRKFPNLSKELSGQYKNDIHLVEKYSPIKKPISPSNLMFRIQGSGINY
jgi:hypothetical protein